MTLLTNKTDHFLSSFKCPSAPTLLIIDLLCPLHIMMNYVPLLFTYCQFEIHSNGQTYALLNQESSLSSKIFISAQKKPRSRFILSPVRSLQKIIRFKSMNSSGCYLSVGGPNQPAPSRSPQNLKNRNEIQVNSLRNLREFIEESK